MYYRPLLVLSLLGITAVAFLRVAGEEVLMLSLAQQTFMTHISLDLLVRITFTGEDFSQIINDPLEVLHSDKI